MYQSKRTRLPIAFLFLASTTIFSSGCGHLSATADAGHAKGRHATSNHEWFIFLAEPMPTALLSNLKGEVQTLVSSTASPGDVVHFVLTPSHTPIATVAVPQGNKKARLRKRSVMSEFQKLGVALKGIEAGESPKIGQVSFPNLPTTIHSMKSTDFPTKVVIVGNPIYDDPKQKGWSMDGGFVPTDVSLQSPTCPFSSDLLFPGDSTVSWLVPSSLWGNGRKHRDAVTRFYRLACQRSGANLTRFSVDPALAFGHTKSQFSGLVIAKSGGEPGVWQASPTSNRGVKKRTTRPVEVPVQPEPQLPAGYKGVQDFLQESMKLDSQISFAMIWHSEDPNCDVDMWISDKDSKTELNRHNMKTSFGQFFRDVTKTRGSGRNAQHKAKFECARINHGRLEDVSLWLNVFETKAPVKIRLIFVHDGLKTHRIIEFEINCGDKARNADQRSTSSEWMHISLL